MYQDVPIQPDKADFYFDLGVTENATSVEIKKAYRQLALIHHPDKLAPAQHIDAVEFRKARNILLP